MLTSLPPIQIRPHIATTNLEQIVSYREAHWWRAWEASPFVSRWAPLSWRAWEAKIKIQKSVKPLRGGLIIAQGQRRPSGVLLTKEGRMSATLGTKPQKYIPSPPLAEEREKGRGGLNSYPWQ